MSTGGELDALIARAQEGDARAFEALVAGHLPQVRRFARAFAEGEADADDLAQDALLRVYRSLRTFRYQAAFSSWLFAVVRSTFLDFSKSRAGRARLRQEPLGPEHDGAPADGAGADEQLVAEAERRRVWRALRAVPVEYRTALVLFDLEGRSYDEVADVEGVAVGTVKSRLSRGRAHLRKLLGSVEGTPDALSAPGNSPPMGESDPGSRQTATAAGTSAGLASSDGRRSGP